jgi:beta-galactosidase GanA
MTSFSGFGRLLHGGDYNPEQWIDTPGIWDADMRLLNEANCNTVSLGIFAWASLEPQEGTYTFEWMDEIFERLSQWAKHHLGNAKRWQAALDGAQISRNPTAPN